MVSGDFYWFNKVNEKLIIAVVDCTGHGVSGAFMSINGHHLLNQNIYGHKKLSASEILNRLNLGVIKELHQEEADSRTKDGWQFAKYTSLCRGETQLVLQKQVQLFRQNEVHSHRRL